MQLRLLIIGSLLVIFLAPLVRADILFIDLNCSAAEIAAARKAAAARGEKLVLLPPRTAAQQQAYTEIHDIDLNMEQASDREKDRLSARESALQDMLLRKGLSSPKFSLDQLNKVLKHYSAQHKTFETVIISGHHTDYFFGQFEDHLNESDIPDAFAKYPKLDQAVHAYYGWGCYTNTPSEAEQWEKAFPKLWVTGGFDENSPGPETSADSDFLAGILAKEARLERQGIANPSKEEMDRMAKVIRAIHDFNLVNGAVCSCGECVGKNIGEISLTQFENCDEAAFNKLSEASSAIDFSRKYGPPCNTGRSDLRQYYNLARLKAYCAAPNLGVDEPFSTYTSDADPALHLIYMRQILANFDLYYADEIKLAKTIAGTCDVQLPDFQRPLACVVGHDPNNPDNPELDSKASGETHYDAVSAVPDDIALMAADCKMTDHEKSALLHLVCALRSLEQLPASWVEPAAHRSDLQTPRLDCEVPE